MAIYYGYRKVAGNGGGGTSSDHKFITRDEYNTLTANGSCETEKYGTLTYSSTTVYCITDDGGSSSGGGDLYGQYLPLSGGTMTGDLILSENDIILNSQAATKEYVDRMIPTGLTYVTNSGKFDSTTGQYDYISVSNNDSWFRLYSDGWCEQGGTIAGLSTGTINLYKTYSNAYFCVLGQVYDTGNANIVQVGLRPTSQKTVKFIQGLADSSTVTPLSFTYRFSWVAKGFIGDLTSDTVSEDDTTVDETSTEGSPVGDDTDDSMASVYAAYTPVEYKSSPESEVYLSSGIKYRIIAVGGGGDASGNGQVWGGGGSGACVQSTALFSNSEVFNVPVKVNVSTGSGQDTTIEYIGSEILNADGGSNGYWEYSGAYGGSGGISSSCGCDKQIFSNTVIINGNSGGSGLGAANGGNYAVQDYPYGGGAGAITNSFYSATSYPPYTGYVKICLEGRTGGRFIITGSNINGGFDAYWDDTDNTYRWKYSGETYTYIIEKNYAKMQWVITRTSGSITNTLSVQTENNFYERSISGSFDDDTVTLYWSVQ